MCYTHMSSSVVRQPIIHSRADTGNSWNGDVKVIIISGTDLKRQAMWEEGYKVMRRIGCLDKGLDELMSVKLG